MQTKKFMTLHEAAEEMGMHYEVFLTKYLDFCLKNDVRIYSIPGNRRKLLNRAEFYRAFDSYAIN